jgi:hypothetical protein
LRHRDQSCAEPFYDLRSVVARLIVDDDDFQFTTVKLALNVRENLFQFGGFIVCANDHAKGRIILRIVCQGFVDAFIEQFGRNGIAEWNGLQHSRMQ